MKILFITSSLSPNDGWGRYSNGLVKETAKQNDIFVVCNDLYYVSGVHQKALLHSPLSVSNPFKIFRSSRKIQKVINSFKPDAVHFLVEPYVVVLPFLKINKNTKTFLTIHGTYSFIPNRFTKEMVKLMIVSPLIKKAYKKLNGIISVSSYTKKYVLEQYRAFYKEDFDQSKIVVISNGIDLSSFSITANNSEEKVASSATRRGGGKSIIFVGAVKRRKGLLESINSLAEYKKNYNGNFIYNIIGSYDERDLYVKEVKSKIKELGLERDIVFHGFADSKKLEALYGEADLFLMLPVQRGTSLEGFGLVYLEANAYGVPVIGGKSSGASDAIMDGVTGYLVNPFNPKWVGEKIHSILDNGSIKPEDCITWTKKQDIKEKAKLVLEFYKSHE